MGAMGDDGSVPIVKVGLKRLHVTELIAEDDVLRECPLLVGVPEDARAAFLSGSVVKRFPDGARVFEEGQPGDSLLLIARGELRLVGRQGEEAVELAVASKGEVVGEAIASGQPLHPFSALARGEVDVVELSRESVMALIARSAATGDYLAAVGRERRAAFQEMASFLGRW